MLLPSRPKQRNALLSPTKFSRILSIISFLAGNARVPRHYQVALLWGGIMTTSVNDFRLFRGELALILDVRQDGQRDIKTIRIVDREGVPTPEEGCASTVPTSELVPLSEPYHIAAAELFLAFRRYSEIDLLVDQTWADVQSRRSALKTCSMLRISETTA